MKILLVGAGAVGQVFGRHLQLGGAEVAFLVKERYAEPCRRGVALYPLNRRRRLRRDPVAFEGFDVLTRLDEVGDRPWDQVWLCVSSTALRGDWLGALLRATGDAAVVSLQPGLGDRALLLRHTSPERLALGVIAFIAWQAPLPGEALEPPGVMYWFPPRSPSPFSGPAEILDPLLSLLRAGGCPAAPHADAPSWAAFPSAVLQAHVAGLELEGWSFRQLRRSDTLGLALRAARQAVDIASAHHDQPPPGRRRLVNRFVARTTLGLASHLVPFDLETYLRVHFTKVGDQTAHLIEETAHRGRQLDLPVDAIEDLLAALRAERSSRGA